MFVTLLFRVERRFVCQRKAEYYNLQARTDKRANRKREEIAIFYTAKLKKGPLGVQSIQADSKGVWTSQLIVYYLV